MITNRDNWNYGGMRSGNMTIANRWLGFAARHGVSPASGMMDS
ncbi:hypothetical protein [Glutamicibacter arilaitensis]